MVPLGLLRELRICLMRHRSELRILLSDHTGFPILYTGISLNIEKLEWIILATAVLHNMVILKNRIYND
jgi:hypothetical protein